jgi:hypothetical protein
MAEARTLWDLVRGGDAIEAEIRAGRHDAVLPEVHEMAIRHAGPGLIGAVRDRLIRLEQQPVPPPDLLPAREHPEVKPFKVTTKKKG